MANMQERLRKATDEALEAKNRQREEAFSALMEEIEPYLAKRASCGSSMISINPNTLATLASHHFENEDMETVVAGLGKRLTAEGLKVLFCKTPIGFAAQISW